MNKKNNIRNINKKDNNNKVIYLTKQQEEFAYAMFEGKTQRQAYYLAYPRSKTWKEESVDAKASALYRNDKVQIRINELKDRITASRIASLEEVLVYFSETMKDKQVSFKDRNFAARELKEHYKTNKENDDVLDKLKDININFIDASTNEVKA